MVHDAGERYCVKGVVLSGCGKNYAMETYFKIESRRPFSPFSSFFSYARAFVRLVRITSRGKGMGGRDEGGPRPWLAGRTVLQNIFL